MTDKRSRATKSKGKEKERNSYVFTFARTFSEVDHAKSFLGGHVRMQTIEHFRRLEATEKAVRGDAYEGLSAIFQPSNIGRIVIAGIPLLPQDLTAPIYVYKEAVKAWHVFCLHTIGITDEDPENYKSLEDMRKVLLLDERCTELGQHVVVLTSPQSFLSKIHRAIQALGYKSQSRVVRYFDEVLYTGTFESDEVPFRKGKRFAYQKEYRIVAKTPSGVVSPLVLELGDLSDIARRTTAEELNRSLTVQVNDRPSD